MLATGTCCCCCGAAVVLLQSNSFQSKKQLLLLLLCPQRHGPPGRGNTMALKDVWSPKWTFPGAGTSLLKSPRKSLLYVSRCWLLGAAAAAGAADPSKRRLPARKLHATEGRQRLLLLLLCPQRHGPPGRGNTMALKDQRSPKYAFPEAGTSLLKSLAIRCWLAANCCTCAVALTAAASACVCCCLLMPAAACCCLLPAAACCSLLLPAAGAAAGGCCCCCGAAVVLLWCCCRAAAIKQLPKQETAAAAAVPTRIRPYRTGKHHALKEEWSTAAAAGAAGPSKGRLPARKPHAKGRERLLCPQRHGPPGWGNTMALKD